MKINQYSSQKAASAVRRKKGKSQSNHVNICICKLYNYKQNMHRHRARDLIQLFPFCLADISRNLFWI